ncbi:MAG: cyclic nucleotide-binding/CBS domain-containing protein [Holophagaceae bacterium]|uniref:Cyclic nucleotide-binding/CBS domain-containing protein n=1 Tax=Candidatus Geothrix skivensis TaxID=2954439 RepID=A0A9D7XH93_9BACT|nr:cyclic nucleotide-binding/CBS domain-containing protein [Candidatus Geothrix skivensis]
MLIDEAVRFLSQVPPFQFLEGPLLRELAQSLTMAFHPKGEVILHQDGPVSEHLQIILKGGVKITLRPEGGGEEVVVDYRERGETFGLVSLMGGHQRTTIVAVQDTTAYLLPKARFSELVHSHPAITEYLLQFHLTKYADMTSREIQGKSVFLESSDHLLFTAQVGEICQQFTTVVEADTSIRQTARRMVEERQSAALVVGPSGEPIGILTDSDFRARVVAEGQPIDGPVSRVMSHPVVSVDEKDPCFEVILKMLQCDIDHVAVTREGAIRGVVTNHDFLVLQGRSPLAFSEDIEHQTTLEGLAPVSRKALSIIGVLLREGARATNIIRIISELNDRVVRKVLEFAERECGPPPVPYCWLALGSEGRKEQTFRTDQDNALIYADVSEVQRTRVAEYFRRFTVYLRNGLVQCGFEACPANYMASNPDWCQPISAWKRYFSTWISEPTPEAVLKSLIFFDFRPLHGDEALAWELREHFGRLIPDYPAFLGFLANMLVRNRPPLGFFGSVAVERSGEHKDGLNLKIKAVAPLVDIARLFALEKGLQQVSTMDRLEALRGGTSLIAELVDELAYAFEFVTLLRVHHQYRQLEAGQPIDNFIHLDGLSNLERQSLKKAFRLILKIQDRVMDRYKSFII